MALNKCFPTEWLHTHTRQLSGDELRPPVLLFLMFSFSKTLGKVTVTGIVQLGDSGWADSGGNFRAQDPLGSQFRR